MVSRHRFCLVSCPRNTRYFAGGQLAVFQGASEAPISESYGSSEQRGKTANWPRPRGCDENGPAAALLVGHVSVQICSLLAPCRRPILIATKYLVFRGQDTRAPSASGHGTNGPSVRCFGPSASRLRKPA